MCQAGQARFEKGRPERPWTNSNHYARHMDAYIRSPSAEHATVQETSERLYLITEDATPKRHQAHIQILDKHDIKKTETVTLQVGKHTVPFILDSGATCNIMCASEYDKMEHKPSLTPSNVDIFQWDQSAQCQA